MILRQQLSERPGQDSLLKTKKHLDSRSRPCAMWWERRQGFSSRQSSASPSMYFLQHRDYALEHRSWKYPMRLMMMAVPTSSSSFHPSNPLLVHRQYYCYWIVASQTCKLPIVVSPGISDVGLWCAQFYGWIEHELLVLAARFAWSRRNSSYVFCSTALLLSEDLHINQYPGRLINQLYSADDGRN